MNFHQLFTSIVTCFLPNLKGPSNLVRIHFILSCKSAEIFVVIFQLVSNLAKISVSVPSISWGVLGQVNKFQCSLLKSFKASEDWMNWRDSLNDTAVGVWFAYIGQVPEPIRPAQRPCQIDLQGSAVTKAQSINYPHEGLPSSIHPQNPTAQVGLQCQLIGSVNVIFIS